MITLSSFFLFSPVPYPLSISAFIILISVHLFKFQLFFQVSTLLITLVHHLFVTGELDAPLIFYLLFCCCQSLSCFEAFLSFLVSVLFLILTSAKFFPLQFSLLWLSQLLFVDLITCLFISYLDHIPGFQGVKVCTNSYLVTIMLGSWWLILLPKCLAFPPNWNLAILSAKILL